RDALRRGRSAAAQRGHARHARQVEERQRGVVVLAAQGERLLEEPLGALVVLQAQEREAQAGDGPRQRVAVPDLAEEAGRLLVEGYGGLGLPLVQPQVGQAVERRGQQPGVADLARPRQALRVQRERPLRVPARPRRRAQPHLAEGDAPSVARGAVALQRPLEAGVGFGGTALRQLREPEVDERVARQRVVARVPAELHALTEERLPGGRVPLAPGQAPDDRQRRPSLKWLWISQYVPSAPASRSPRRRSAPRLRSRTASRLSCSWSSRATQVSRSGPSSAASACSASARKYSAWRRRTASSAPLSIRRSSAYSWTVFSMPKRGSPPGASCLVSRLMSCSACSSSTTSIPRSLAALPTCSAASSAQPPANTAMRRKNVFASSVSRSWLQSSAYLSVRCLAGRSR